LNFTKTENRTTLKENAFWKTFPPPGHGTVKRKKVEHFFGSPNLRQPHLNASASTIKIATQEDSEEQKQKEWGSVVDRGKTVVSSSEMQKTTRQNWAQG
jgi:hypothetical protein